MILYGGVGRSKNKPLLQTTDVGKDHRQIKVGGRYRTRTYDFHHVKMTLYQLS